MGISLTTNGHHHHHSCRHHDSSHGGGVVEEGGDGGRKVDNQTEISEARAKAASVVKSESGSVGQEDDDPGESKIAQQASSKRESPDDLTESVDTKAGEAAEAQPSPQEVESLQEVGGELPGSEMILSMALLLIRHAMQDTYGTDAVTVSESKGEVLIFTDGHRATLRVVVGPPLEADGKARGGGEAAWSCEVVECEKDPLRTQLTLLLERLRAAVAKS